jgi:ATP-dependent DNA ligase
LRVSVAHCCARRLGWRHFRYFAAIFFPDNDEVEVELIAFDVLALAGDDLRELPLSMRKRLVARRPDGIFLAGFEQRQIGPDLFRKACEFGLEGLISKPADRPYRGARSPYWIKVKNRNHPAVGAFRLAISRQTAGAF